MNDREKKSADLNDSLWKQIERVDHATNSLRNALQQVGPGASALMAAEIVAGEALELLKVAAQSAGHADAVRMM